MRISGYGSNDETWLRYESEGGARAAFFPLVQTLVNTVLGLTVTMVLML